MQVHDPYDRAISRFRVAITSNCNLNCIYCHHEGNPNSAQDFLSLNQIRQIATLIPKYDISSVKITGGEPLLHPKISQLIEIFRGVSQDLEISMTTNGILLESLASSLKQAGLDRVNIGCDSFQEMKVKNMQKIQSGIFAAKEARLKPIKINMVILKGINEQEIPQMIEFAKNNEFILQLIELINTNEQFFQQYHVDLEPIEEQLAKQSVNIKSANMHDRKVYHLKDNAVVEVVGPVNNSHFCAQCSTMRITSDFKFQTCLHQNQSLIPIGNNIEQDFLSAIQKRKPYVLVK